MNALAATISTPHIAFAKFTSTVSYSIHQAALNTTFLYSVHNNNLYLFQIADKLQAATDSLRAQSFDNLILTHSGTCDARAPRFLDAVRARAIADIVSTSATPTVFRFADGFLLNRPHRPIVYFHLHLHLAVPAASDHPTHLVLHPTPYNTPFIPLPPPSALRPGTPLLLIPYATPAYFLAPYSGPTAPLINLFRDSLSGLGVPLSDDPRFIIGWLRVQSTDTSPRGTLFIWPARLCLAVHPASSIAHKIPPLDPLPHLPPPLQPSPPPASPPSSYPPYTSFNTTSLKAYNLLTAVTGKRKHLHTAADEVGSYVDLIARERERERERLKREREGASSPQLARKPVPIPTQLQPPTTYVPPVTPRPPPIPPFQPSSFYPSPPVSAPAPVPAPQQQIQSPNIEFQVALPPQPQVHEQQPPTNSSSNPTFPADFAAGSMNDFGMLDLDFGMDVDLDLGIGMGMGGLDMGMGISGMGMGMSDHMAMGFGTNSFGGGENVYGGGQNFASASGLGYGGPSGTAGLSGNVEFGGATTRYDHATGYTSANEQSMGVPVPIPLPAGTTSAGAGSTTGGFNSRGSRGGNSSNFGLDFEDFTDDDYSFFDTRPKVSAAPRPPPLAATSPSTMTAPWASTAPPSALHPPFAPPLTAGFPPPPSPASSIIAAPPLSAAWTPAPASGAPGTATISGSFTFPYAGAASGMSPVGPSPFSPAKKSAHHAKTRSGSMGPPDLVPSSPTGGSSSASPGTPPRTPGRVWLDYKGLSITSPGGKGLLGVNGVKAPLFDPLPFASYHEEADSKYTSGKFAPASAPTASSLPLDATDKIAQPRAESTRWRKHYDQVTNPSIGIMRQLKLGGMRRLAKGWPTQGANTSSIRPRLGPSERGSPKAAWGRPLYDDWGHTECEGMDLDRDTGSPSSLPMGRLSLSRRSESESESESEADGEEDGDEARTRETTSSPGLSRPATPPPAYLPPGHTLLHHKFDHAVLLALSSLAVGGSVVAAEVDVEGDVGVDGGAGAGAGAGAGTNAAVTPMSQWDVAEGGEGGARGAANAHAAAAALSIPTPVSPSNLVNASSSPTGTSMKVGEYGELGGRVVDDAQVVEGLGERERERQAKEREVRKEVERAVVAVALECVRNPLWAEAWFALNAPGDANENVVTAGFEAGRNVGGGEAQVWPDDLRQLAEAFAKAESMEGPLQLAEIYGLADASSLPTTSSTSHSSSTTTPAFTPLSPPHLSVGKGNTVIQVLPSALRFWDKLGLGPRGGRKEINVYVVYDEELAGPVSEAGRWSNAADEEEKGQVKSGQGTASPPAVASKGKATRGKAAKDVGAKSKGAKEVKEKKRVGVEGEVEEWIKALCSVYEGKRMGRIRRGQSSIASDGLLPVRYDGTFRKSISSLISTIHEAATVPTVVFLLLPPHILSLSSPNLRGLLAALSEAQATTGGQVIFHLLPHTTVVPQAISSPLAHETLSSLCLSVYDRIKGAVARRGTPAMFTPSPAEHLVQECAFSVARPLVERVSYRREAKGSLDVLDRGMMLHVGYRLSRCGRWIVAACVDQRGEAWDMEVWAVGGDSDAEEGDEVVEQGGGGEGDVGFVVDKVMDFVMALAVKANVEWRVVITKLGVLTIPEQDVWQEKIAATQRRQRPNEPIHFYLMSAEYDAPWTLLDARTPVIPSSASPPSSTGQSRAPPSSAHPKISTSASSASSLSLSHTKLPSALSKSKSPLSGTRHGSVLYTDASSMVYAVHPTTRLSMVESTTLDALCSVGQFQICAPSRLERRTHQDQERSEDVVMGDGCSVALDDADRDEDGGGLEIGEDDPISVLPLSTTALILTPNAVEKPIGMLHIHLLRACGFGSSSTSSSAPLGTSSSPSETTSPASSVASPASANAASAAGQVPVVPDPTLTHLDVTHNFFQLSVLARARHVEANPLLPLHLAAIEVMAACLEGVAEAMVDIDCIDAS